MIILEDILKVKFLKPNESISTTNGYSFTEDDIEFDDLITLLNDIENIKGGLGKSLHNEAFTGIDYLGNGIKFNSYVIWTENEIFKYNFDESLVPFNNEILKRNRDKTIDDVLK
jgi:hypothetical protein